jgi:hypothetical protein
MLSGCRGRNSLIVKRHLDDNSNLFLPVTHPYVTFFVLLAQNSFAGQNESQYIQVCSFMKVPFSNSSNAICSSSCVFMTIGPYHATGSPIGLPEIRRKRTGESSALIATPSPLHS